MELELLPSGVDAAGLQIVLWKILENFLFIGRVFTLVTFTVL